MPIEQCARVSYGNLRKRTLRAILSTAVVLSGWSTAGATLIYDNGLLNITNSMASRSITNFRDADDFVLGAPESISSIRFWLNNNNLPLFSGTITYAFYQDSAGALGTLVGSGTVNPAVTIVPLGSFTNVPQLDATLASPVNLAAGTYWLELHEGPTLTTNDSSLAFWVVRNGTAGGNTKQDPVPTLPTTAISPGVEMGFQLFDSAGSGVPEPSTGIPVILALGSFALIRGLSRSALRHPMRSGSVSTISAKNSPPPRLAPRIL